MSGRSRAEPDGVGCDPDCADKNSFPELIVWSRLVACYPWGRSRAYSALASTCWRCRRPDSVAATRAYSNGPIRRLLRRRGIRHTIPEKSDSRAARLRKGSRGGRPPACDKQRYAKRNTIERTINRLKQFRAVATRYDKRGYVFLGSVTTAALAIWLRT